MAFPAPPERYRFGPFELQPDKRRLQKDGVIRATNVLAKCGSRYAAVPKA